MLLRVRDVHYLDPTARVDKVRRVGQRADDALPVAVADHAEEIAAASTHMLDVEQARGLTR